MGNQLSLSDKDNGRREEKNPLEIPELLSKILSHTNNYDLLKEARLTNRFWNDLLTPQIRNSSILELRLDYKNHPLVDHNIINSLTSALNPSNFTDKTNRFTTIRTDSLSLGNPDLKRLLFDCGKYVTRLIIDDTLLPCVILYIYDERKSIIKTLDELLRRSLPNLKELQLTGCSFCENFEEFDPYRVELPIHLRDFILIRKDSKTVDYTGTFYLHRNKSKFPKKCLPLGKCLKRTFIVERKYKYL